MKGRGRITVRFDADERPDRVMATWCFDRKTGVLTGQSVVHGQFFANGDCVYRVPAGETLQAPPEVPDGQVAVYIESKNIWVLLEDHRGETWRDYMGRPVPIERPGDPGEWGLRR